MAPGTQNLRLHLREATAQAHDRLDAGMRSVAGWSDLSQYSRFLSLQYAARQSVEDWLSEHAEPGLLPPPQIQLIARDLAALDAPIPEAAQFAFSETRPAAVGGIAWALAGSSLGNRAILKDIRRAAGGASIWPETFLADPAMPAFWADLRRRIEGPASPHEAEAARAAAAALFDHFTTAVLSHTPREAVFVS